MAYLMFEDLIPPKKRKYTKASRQPMQDPLQEDEYEKIENLAALGSDYAQIAAMLGFSRPSFEKMIEKDARLRESVDRGRERGNSKVASVAYKMATSGNHPAMTMFWLKCRMRWREHDHTTLYAKGVMDADGQATVPVVTFVIEQPDASKKS